MRLSEIIRHLEIVAPPGLAYSWDNSGLQIGRIDAEISKVLVSLDVTPNTVNKAIEIGAELIVSHHPLIFDAQKSFTNPLHLQLIENHIAVYSMHTNLDVVNDGVNHCLARALGLEIVRSLSLETGSKWYHLSVTVPSEALESVRSAAFAAGAGRIGVYASCSTSHPVKGSFMPMQGSVPYQGKLGTYEEVEELELEMMVDSIYLGSVQKAILNLHPYETPAMYYYKVDTNNPAYGLGLLCKYKNPLSLMDLKGIVADKLYNPCVRLWTASKGDSTIIEKIALCGGSGNSMINEAAKQADVLITGDISYHNLLDSKVPIIDAGHFYTEYPVLEYLAEKLRESGIQASVLNISDHEYYQNMH